MATKAPCGGTRWISSYPASRRPSSSTVARNVGYALRLLIVPAHNEAANIVATIRSLLANNYPDMEIVVVDDASGDGIADLPERLGELRGKAGA